MAGEYYRWLARNTKPEEKRELTPQEKRRNWWYYHKWYILAAAAGVLLLAAVFGEAADANRNRPDYQITYVGNTALPEDTRQAVELAFAALGEDLNGNGEVRVEIMEYPLSSDDPMMDYNASLQLMTNVEKAESMIYLLEDPELFQENYPILTGVDGSDPDSGAPLWYRWGDCPVLAGLELGSFEFSGQEGTTQVESQTVLADLCIARRGLWNDSDTEETDGALRLWDALTQNAG